MSEYADKLKKEFNKEWKCSRCNEVMKDDLKTMGSWRFNGSIWEHKCPDALSQAGHFPAYPKIKTATGFCSCGHPFGTVTLPVVCPRCDEPFREIWDLWTDEEITLMGEDKYEELDHTQAKRLRSYGLEIPYKKERDRLHKEAHEELAKKYGWETV